MQSSAAKKNVLIVDDIEANRLILGKALRAAGYVVSEAATGQQAVDQIDSDQPLDLVLLDLGLPDFDGMQVLKLIRKSRRHGKLKVCIASARTDAVTISKATALGSDDFVSKPVNPATLVAKVTSMLNPVVASGSFHSVETLLKCKLVGTPIEPDLRVIKLSESGITLKSSAAMTQGARIEIKCDTLSKSLDEPQTFVCTVVKSSRVGYGRYAVDLLFTGLSESAVQKLRAMAIRGELISDFH